MAETVPNDQIRRRVAVDSAAICDFCRRHYVRRLSLFGSVLRDDFRPDSDVDLLVEFDSTHAVGFFGLAAMELELSNLLGRKVDLRTPNELSRYFRDEVLSSAEPLYAAP